MSAPVFEVTEIADHAGRILRTIRTCAHANLEPVIAAVSGEHVADLCLDCDVQLSA